MARKVTLTQVEAFHVVATSSSYVRAAEKLGCSESAVHQNVGAIERSLQVRLFDVGRRRLKLTAVGAELAEVAAQISAGMDKFENVATMFREETLPHIVVAAGRVTGSFLLRYVLSDIRLHQPNVEYQFSRTNAIVAILLRGECQIGVVMEEQVRQQEGRIAVLADNRDCDFSHADSRVLVATPWLFDSWILVRGVLPDRVEPRGHEVRRVFYARNHVDWDPTLLELLSSLPSAQCLALDSVEAVKSAAIGRLGEALLPAMSVVDEVNNGLLEYSSDPLASRRLFIISPRQTSPSVEYVRGMMAEWLPPEGMCFTGIEYPPS